MRISKGVPPRVNGVPTDISVILIFSFGVPTGDAI